MYSSQTKGGLLAAGTRGAKGACSEKPMALMTLLRSTPTPFKGPVSPLLFLLVHGCPIRRRASTASGKSYSSSNHPRHSIV